MILTVFSMACYALAGIIVIVVIVACCFNKDICEDIANDEVNRHYSGEE